MIDMPITKGTKVTGPALFRTRQTGSRSRELIWLGSGRTTQNKPSRDAHPGFKRCFALQIFSLTPQCLRFVRCAPSLTQVRAMTRLFQPGASLARLRMREDAQEDQL